MPLVYYFSIFAFRFVGSRKCILNLRFSLAQRRRTIWMHPTVLSRSMRAIGAWNHMMRLVSSEMEWKFFGEVKYCFTDYEYYDVA